MSRPNIVFIITDQQRLDTIQSFGYNHMVTPNLDRLVQNGTSFDHMYVTSPVCSPSRASLFSGVYPHNNGVLRNDEHWNYTWVPLLAKAGYRCVNIGKMHTSPFEQLFGFHERHVTENKDRSNPSLPFFLDNWDKALWARGLRKPSRETYCELADYSERLGAFVWDLPEEMHPDVFVPEMAMMWLDRYKENEPFFLQIGIPGPHPPYDPTAEAIALYDDRTLPEAIRDYDLDAQQPHAMVKLRENHNMYDHDAVVHLKNPTPEQLRRQRAHYYANVTMIDQQVGRIIETLDQRGILDNTVIIFTSDHGDCLNDHGHSQKWSMFEQSVRVPAVIQNPRATLRDNRISDLVSLFDFGPTILELAGIKTPEWMEARSLTPYFEIQKDPTRKQVFAELANDLVLEHAEFITMIREGSWKLVHILGSDEGQLFDLEVDPNETNNLWSVSGHTGVKQYLISEILNWRLRSSLKTQAFINDCITN